MREGEFMPKVEIIDGVTYTLRGGVLVPCTPEDPDGPLWYAFDPVTTRQFIPVGHYKDEEDARAAMLEQGKAYVYFATVAKIKAFLASAGGVPALITPHPDNLSKTYQLVLKGEVIRAEAFSVYAPGCTLH